MNAKDALVPLLRNLSSIMGTDLALDHEGICLLENEDGTECEISALPDSTDFLLTSLVGELDEHDSKSFYVDLMMLNGDVGQTFGATIGLDRPSGLLMLHQMHSVRGLEADAFEVLIEDFYGLTDSLSQLIQSRRIAPTIEPPKQTEETPVASPTDDDRPWRRV